MDVHQSYEATHDDHTCSFRGETHDVALGDVMVRSMRPSRITAAESKPSLCLEHYLVLYPREPATPHAE